MTGQDAAKRAAYAWYEEYQIAVECAADEDFDWYIACALAKYADAAVAEAVAEKDRLIACQKDGLLTLAEAVKERYHQAWESELEEARREERERIIQLCVEHDNQCLDPQGCDVMTIAATLRRPPASAPESTGPFMCSARRNGRDEGDPCMKVEGHKGAHKFAKIRPLTSAPEGLGGK